MTLRVELFGGVHVTTDGAPVDLGGRRPRLLLASLALADGRVVGTDRLIDLVWGDEPPPTARRTLQSYASGLRLTLGGDAGPLAATGPGYVLAIDRSQIDLFVFANGVERAKGEVGDDPSAAAVQLRAAIDSWGEPLDGLRPTPGLQAILAPYEELRLEALETLNDVELDHGDVGQAVARLEELVREHPLRERFWTQLVRGLAALGRRDSALHACQRAREALREQLGVTPSPLLQRLEREILDGQPQSPLDESDAPSPAATVQPGNLVRPPIEFIGRTAELRDLPPELTRRRLVTLTGAGGVGKTRLAIELGWSVRDGFPDGVWFIGLAAVGDPQAVPAAVVSTLSVPPQREMTLPQSLIDWLSGRQLLLIVDSCEHVLAAVADLVTTVVTTCPTVTVLATSREPLGVPGERIHLVSPLDPASEGVDLFVERAGAAEASFRPSAEDRAAITAICTRLDGIPLAIELAAARIRSLAPHDLLARLDDRFGLLHGPASDGSNRHLTMRATVDWSYQLLEPRERLLFDRLSVFAGGYDLTAAETACGDDDKLRYEDIAAVLGALVDKSLIVADRDPHGVRYRQLDPMRRYGRDRLQARGESTLMRDRHLEHYLEVSRRTKEMWCSPRQLDADDIFEREWDNLRAAHAWAIETANLSAVDGLIDATGMHAWCRVKHEHGDWATRALMLATSDRRVSATTYGWAAYWAYFRDDQVDAVVTARQGVDAAPVPDHPDTCGCWSVLVLNGVVTGRRVEAHEHARHAQVAAASVPDSVVEWWVLFAVVELAFGDDLAALPDLLTRLAAVSATVGAPSLRARSLVCQGRLRMWATATPDVEGALGCYRRGLAVARETHDVNAENLNLVGIMYTETRLGDVHAGETCREAITRFSQTRHWTLFWLALGAVTSWWRRTDRLAALAVVYGHLDAHHPAPHSGDASHEERQAALQHPDAAELTARGAAMDRDELVSFVIDQLAMRDRWPGPHGSPVTPS